MPDRFSGIVGPAGPIVNADVIFDDAWTCPRPRTSAWVPVGLVMVAAFSMAAFALLEMLSGMRTRRRAQALLHPITSVRRLIARARRYTQVSIIAVRNGLWRPGTDDPQR